MPWRLPHAEPAAELANVAHGPHSPGNSPSSPRYTSTPDLFANTSLEEPAVLRRPPFTGQSLILDNDELDAPMILNHDHNRRYRSRFVPRNIQSRLEAANMSNTPINIGASNGNTWTRRPSLRSNDTQHSADWKAERLRKYRETLPPLKNLLFNSVSAWQREDPAAAKEYIKHMENCVIATSTPVLATDYMLWYPDLPKTLQANLTLLNKAYHGEAFLMCELRKAEARAGSWSDVRDTHPEIVHVAKGCKMDYAPESPGERNGLLAVVCDGMYHRCGLDDPTCVQFTNLDVLDHPAQKALTTREIILRIQANFDVRETARVWAPELKSDVMEWVLEAYEFLDNMLGDQISEDSADWELWTITIGTLYCDIQEYNGQFEGQAQEADAEAEGEEDAKRANKVARLE